MAEYGYGTIATVGEDGFNSVDWVAMNKGVTPVFTIIPIENGVKSEEQKRAVYDNTEVVLLYIAGDQFSVHSALVDEAIKRRFPEQYANWKRTNEGRTITGTPLKFWPMATPAFIKELEAINVFSVDDLANIADVHVNNMPDGRMWRDRAAAWLANAADTAATSRFAAENDRLRERLEALEDKLRKQIQSEFKEELRSADGKTYKKRGPRGMTPERREEARQRMQAMWAKRKAAQAS
jgi:hypothetical protein